MTIEDLRTDAWIAAVEIGGRRGWDIDFNSPGDQKLLLGALYNRNVKRPEKNMRYASRIDQPREDDEGNEETWANVLQADDESDPLTTLLKRESALNEKELLASSYSQAAAYVMVFVRFKNDRQAVCAYLVISDTALAKRITVASDSVRVQPSLFDRIERIDEDFMPLPGRQYVTRIEQHRETEQWRWEF